MTKLYTSTLDPALQQLVRSIPALKGDEFKTRRFQKKDGATHWREAYREPGTNFWTVEMRAQAPGLYVNEQGKNVFSEAREEAKPVLSRVCFLDALHACASFEQGEVNLKHLPFEEAIQDIDGTHYHIFAEEEGIPFNRQGLPVPASQGRPVVPGQYAPGAFETAKKTKDVKLVTLDPVVDLAEIKPGVMNFPVLSGSDSTGHVVGVKNRSALVRKQKDLETQAGKAVQKIDNTIQKIEKLTEDFNEAMAGHFKTIKMKEFSADDFIIGRGPGENCATGVLLATVTGSMAGLASQSFLGAALIGIPAFIGPPLVYLASRTYLPSKAFNKTVRDIRKEAKKRPVSYGEAMLQFADNIELAARAVETRQAYKAVKKGTRREERRIEKCMKLFNKLAKAQSRDEGMVDNMRRALAADLETDNFENQMQTMIADGVKALTTPLEEQKGAVRKDMQAKQNLLLSA